MVAGLSGKALDGAFRLFFIGQTHRALAAARRRSVAPPPDDSGPAADGIFCGFLSLLLSVLLVLPIPLGNVLPALAISLMALGVLERDGVWVLAGFAVAAAAGSVIYGVLFAMVKAGLYFFTQVV